MARQSTAPSALTVCTARLCRSRFVTTPMRAIERRLHETGAMLRFPPVFILGAPRCGSTLLYQAMTRRFACCYIDNLMALFPETPALASRLSRRCFGSRPHHSLASTHGRTGGLHAPHECGEFWYRWFPRDPIYTPAGALPRASLDALRAAVAAMEAVWQQPLVFKNLYCTMRLMPIREAFPEALFIVCRRDPLACARSILKGRRDALGSIDPWWSLKPREYDTIAQHAPATQIAEQIYYTYGQAERDLADLAPHDRVHELHYEHLCAAPRAVLERVRAWLLRNRIPLDERAQIPGQFTCSRGPRLARDEETELEHAVNTLFGSSNPKTEHTR